MELTNLFVILTVAAAISCESAHDEFVKGNLKFTADLYKEAVKKQKENFVCSPFSAQAILALTRAGAKGETANEFTSALSLPIEKETEEVLKELTTALQHSTADLKVETAYKLYVAHGLSIDGGFKQIATGSFGADVENVDFAKSEEARSAINHWVEEQTNGKIRELVPNGSISATTQLLLVNALYFSGKWMMPFASIGLRDFHQSSSETNKVEMMTVEKYFDYYEDAQLDAKYLVLPYEGKKASMVVVLPNKIDGLAKLEGKLEETLKPKKFENLLVSVTMPMFLTESRIPLVDILKTLGLNKAFTDDADFSGISPSRLIVGEVLQKAFINVTVSGTEAAAATNVEFMVTATLTDPIQFNADRPFFYYIKYEDVVLFAGNVKKM